MSDPCPTCGRKLLPSLPPRKMTCLVCGKEFEQSGPGRPRKTCSKECANKRALKLRNETRPVVEAV